MYVNYENRLHKSVIKFKKRADKVHPQWSEVHDNGEWEIVEWNGKSVPD